MFFEAISASAPHIYHTVLPLCPRTSVVWGLYEAYANPFVRLVYGTPNSWDLHAATFKCNAKIDDIAWSPCSRFIAVAPHSYNGMQILDAVTVDQLFTTSPISWPEGIRPLKEYENGCLLFSPDGHLLTYCKRGCIFIWDLQTGGLNCNLHINDVYEQVDSMTFSDCGAMVGVLFTEDDTSVIHTCNIVTSANMASYLPRKRTILIWTHAKHLRFATLGDLTIIIWEAEFTFENSPTMIESLPIPYQVSSGSCPFNPTLYYLASTYISLHVWDIHNSRFLIKSGPGYPGVFSPDGSFFASATRMGLSIWKQSPTGYTLIQKIPVKRDLGHDWYKLLSFSPNGRFLLVQCEKEAFQLWSTEVSVTPLSDSSVQTPYQETRNFLLEFSSANTLAIVTKTAHKVVTALDLKASTPQLTINVDAEVYAVRVVGGTAFVLSAGDIYTWDIPTWVSGFDHSARIVDSISTTTLKDLNMLASLHGKELWGASISPDSHFIAANIYVWKGNTGTPNLCIYDTVTGDCLYLNEEKVGMAWFNPDSSELCAIRGGKKIRRWKITEDGKPNITKLEDQELTEVLTGEPPWLSTCSYKITDDGWILSPSRKLLLWLPHHWRLGEKEKTRKWGGHYLALLDGRLPEAIILDLCPEGSLSN